MGFVLKRHAARLAAMLLSGLASCSPGSICGPGSPPAVSDVLDAVAVDGALVYAEAGSLPAGDDPAPVIDAASTWVDGAAVALRVRVDGARDELRVGVSGRAGWYRVALPGRAAAGSGGNAPRDLLLVVRPRLGLGGVAELAIAAADGQTTTRIARHPLAARRDAASSADLQVTLSWPDAVDMDLHLETPDSLDVYRGAPAAGGGVLDLDSNGGCVIDQVQAENITWGAGSAASGTYRIRINLWSACLGPGPFPWVVTIRRCSQVEMLTGTFTLADETQGEAFSGRLIRTLDLSPCPAP